MSAIHPFPGTEDEQYRLAKAVSQNCTCTRSDDGIAGPECPACALLTTDESLKHLVFWRRLRRKVLEQEFML
jgi:hypothetical protein